MQHVHAGKACADHDDVKAGFGSGGWHGGHKHSLKFHFDLPTSIPAAAPKRKTQIRALAMHILRGGMRSAPHGEEHILRVSNHEATVGACILRDGRSATS